MQKIKFRVKRIERIENNIERIENKSKLYLNRISDKLVIDDDGITSVHGVKFYVPYYPTDYIQRVLVETGQFFEQNDILKESNKYLNNESIVFDLGANIGNHTLYWAKKTCVKKVYAFEPVDETFEIFKKNISLNNLNDDKVVINHVGLGQYNGKASIKGEYNLENIGGTSIKMDGNGNLNVITLDSYVNEHFSENKIDLIKIDVEGFEYELLLGAKDVLTKYNPVIIIESFKDKFEKVNELLKKYGYKLKESLPAENYLYIKE